MSTFEIVLAGVFAAWLTLTLVAHMPWGACRALRRADRAGLLPYWNFFAPNPAVVDLHLVMQFRTPQPSPWVEYPVPSRGPWDWLFHSGRRRRKALVDLISQLGSDAASGLNALRISVPYILFLDIAQGFAPPDADAARFALISFSASGRNCEVVMTSDFHPLP